jgi:hypothetical protein
MNIPRLHATDDIIHQLIRDEICRRGHLADLNHIDVSKVSNMDNLFKQSHFNGDISKWDTSNLTTAVNMFMGSAFNGDLSHWNVRSLRQASSMFFQSDFNRSLDQWSLESCVNFNFMFAFSAFRQPLPSWRFPSATQMRGTFQGTHLNWTADMLFPCPSHVPAEGLICLFKDCDIEASAFSLWIGTDAEHLAHIEQFWTDVKGNHFSLSDTLIQAQAYRLKTDVGLSTLHQSPRPKVI